MENICIGLSLLGMTSFNKKISFFNEIELHCYVFTINAIFYKLMYPVFTVLEDTFCINIIPYKSFSKICLSATKFVLQAEW